MDSIAFRVQTVDCTLHGRSVLEPRHLDRHHTPDCPAESHCPYCWHGYPLSGCWDAATCEAVEELMAARAEALWNEHYGAERLEAVS